MLEVHSNDDVVERNFADHLDSNRFEVALKKKKIFEVRKFSPKFFSIAAANAAWF